MPYANRLSVFASLKSDSAPSAAKTAVANCWGLRQRARLSIVTRLSALTVAPRLTVKYLEIENVDVSTPKSAQKAQKWNQDKSVKQLYDPTLHRLQLLASQS
jgi:hypothetical protein